MKFFKFYYDKLTKEHPRWNTHHISIIIKLLWKKKLVKIKNPITILSEHKNKGKVLVVEWHSEEHLDIHDSKT